MKSLGVSDESANYNFTTCKDKLKVLIQERIHYKDVTFHSPCVKTHFKFPFRNYLVMAWIVLLMPTTLYSLTTMHLFHKQDTFSNEDKVSWLKLHTFIMLDNSLTLTVHSQTKPQPNMPSKSLHLPSSVDCKEETLLLRSPKLELKLCKINATLLSKYMSINPSLL